ncbi:MULTISPECIES: DUF3870 domain-containing protein [Sciscionella]|uniref:DUF3870 domain-containing protein n=1 Tax=Sciscionella TaxID=596495 RepID=UPI0003A5097F|nr:MULTISPECIES: DUF3870 domain-containing protein [Sciscionella]
MDLFEFFREQLAAGTNLVLVSGYARLPDAVANHSQYERVGVVLVVDLDSGTVVAAEPTMLTSLAKDFFRALVEETSVYTEATEVLRRIETHYKGGSGAALVTAFRKCLESVYVARNNG